MSRFTPLVHLVSTYSSQYSSQGVFFEVQFNPPEESKSFQYTTAMSRGIDFWLGEERARIKVCRYTSLKRDRSVAKLLRKEATAVFCAWSVEALTVRQYYLEKGDASLLQGGPALYEALSREFSHTRCLKYLRDGKHSRLIKAHFQVTEVLNNAINANSIWGVLW